MALQSTDRILLWAAMVRLLIGLVCLLLLTVETAPVLGVHPALKPFKFGLSIALFLATMPLVIPALGVSSGMKTALAWALHSPCSSR